MIVASDLEGTLTTGATWRGVGSYLVGAGHGVAFRLFFLSHLPRMALARLGIITVQKFRDDWVRDLPRLWRGFRPDQLEAMAEWVVEQELWPKRRPEVIAELEALRSEGHRLILASGTYQPVIEAFARRLGGEGLGTAVEMANGQATGRLLSAINNGEAKAATLRAALNGDTLLAAYGDTAPDIPMLAMSQRPVAVAPDAELRQTAQARGWRILDSVPQS